MDPREDDVPFDDSNGGDDAVIRALRAEMLRLEAELDQLSAAARDRAEQMDELRAKLDELERLMERVRNRFRLRARLWAWSALCYGVALGMWLSWLVR